jgi:hypothetical protein
MAPTLSHISSNTSIPSCTFFNVRSISVWIFLAAPMLMNTRGLSGQPVYMHAGNRGQSMAPIKLAYVPLVSTTGSNWHSAHLLTLRVDGERTADTGDTRFTEAQAVWPWGIGPLGLAQ